MSERIEVGDVVLHEGKEFTVQDTRSVYIGQGSLNALLIDDNRWVSTSVVKLFAKKAPQVFEVGDTFTHMHGYDGEVFTVAAVLSNGNIVTTTNATCEPHFCTLASKAVKVPTVPTIPVDTKDPYAVPLFDQLQPDCKWVKKGWALHPTDFKMEDGKKVTAEYAGRSWDVLTEEEAAKHEWQRPRELDIDILHTMKRIKTAANKLGEAEGQKFIWEMLQTTAKAAKVLSEIRDRAEADAKALQGGQS